MEDNKLISILYRLARNVWFGLLNQTILNVPFYFQS